MRAKRAAPAPAATGATKVVVNGAALSAATVACTAAPLRPCGAVARYRNGEVYRVPSAFV